MQINRILPVFIVIFLFACSSQKTVWTNEESTGTSNPIILKPNKPDSERQDTIKRFNDDQSFARTEILWDEWGVPHIYARNNDELFYAFGWAQMKSHANTILKLYGTSRGRAAEYWGAKFIDNDLMVHTIGFPKLSGKWYSMQSPEFQAYIDHFVKGMNDYVNANPGVIQEKNKVVLPIERNDVLGHALFVLYSRFVGGGDLQQVPRWEETGSNTYAVGPKRSASGHAMLVMNPHLPWFDEWLFTEGHFNAPGVHIYGATLVGLPTLGIAFNEHLGWSHTNNTIDNADLYELILRDGGYVVDGAVRAFEQGKMGIKIKQDDGNVVIKDFPRLVSPDHGPVLKQEGARALAIKMPGFDRPYGMVQWWRMGNAKSLSEFKMALKEVQIPFFNIMYADKEGNIFYMFNGQVPQRQVGDWRHWQGLVDGSKSENLWSKVHDYRDLPKTENPPSGYLQNANDPPWTSTFPRTLHPEDYPAYMAPVTMTFRPQRAARMMDEDGSITFDELINYKTSTRIEMADRLLDDLYAAVSVHGSKTSREAMLVLNKWDRHANKDSRGMYLFYSWAHAMGPWNREIYKEQWSLEKARSTPDGLANPAQAVQTLEEVVRQFKEANIPLDIPWGEVYRIKYGDYDLPGNGADGSVGIFRVAWTNGREEDGKYYISGGDSWQGVIEFGDQVRAKVLMSYGSSSEKNSPHYGDQLQLFSNREMRDCYFYRKDVIKHVKKTEVLDLTTKM